MLGIVRCGRYFSSCPFVLCLQPNGQLFLSTVFHWILMTTLCRGDIIPIWMRKFEPPVLCDMNRVHSTKKYYSLDLELSLVTSKPIQC